MQYLNTSISSEQLPRMISFLGYNYLPVLSPATVVVKMIETFLHQLLPVRIKTSIKSLTLPLSCSINNGVHEILVLNYHIYA